MHYDSIGELSTRIRERTVSPVEVVEACLKRIETLNPALNAFITVMVEDARAQAGVAEAEVAAGRWRGPLHGVPVAVKDFYDTAGVATTAGFEPFKDRVPAADAEVVKRLKHAGAIVIGKTNMDALGMATTGLTSYFGPVRNPWNRDYSLPVASVPCGFDGHGLPIGLQIVGRPGQERTVLNVAHHFERAPAIGMKHPMA